ncbi:MULTISPECIES: hypothetical protein [Enterococcus]|uniref:hypothetical protein n=1 Tax=Enterococcus TaxID=1350 RepID=UPI001E3497EB|nr:hypothetical protein [Enterococcus casseliflavus]
MDLGCGYRFAGIYLAKKYTKSTVIMTDICLLSIRIETSNFSELTSISTNNFIEQGSPFK